MILQEKEQTSLQNYRSIYEKADPAVKARFRARRSYLRRVKHLTEEEAISQALDVFNLATTKITQPMISAYEPTSEEIETVVNELKNCASVITISDPDSSQNQTHFSSSEDSSRQKPKPSIVEETRIKKMKNSSNILRGLFRYFSKYTLIKLCLYALIVPVTANAVHSAISQAGLNNLFSTILSWVLALITDFIALDHFSSAEDPKEKNEDLFSLGIAVLILAGNLFGAYFLFNKEMKIEESLQQNLKIESLMTKLSTLKDETAEAEARYLAKKFPEASDPKACEEGKSSKCGEVFKKASKSEKVEFLSKTGQVKNLEEDILKMKARSSKTNATSGSFWLHFGYYCCVWLLLFSVIRLEAIKKRRLKTCV